MSRKETRAFQVPDEIIKTMEEFPSSGQNVYILADGHVMLAIILNSTDQTEP